MKANEEAVNRESKLTRVGEPNKEEMQNDL